MHKELYCSLFIAHFPFWAINSHWIELQRCFNPLWNVENQRWNRSDMHFCS